MRRVNLWASLVSELDPAGGIRLGDERVAADGAEMGGAERA